jgi:mannosyltransferase
VEQHTLQMNGIPLEEKEWSNNTGQMNGIPLEEKEWSNNAGRLGLCLGFMIGMGAALRLYQLDGQSLWVDEGLQYFAASAESLGEVVGRALGWANPPLSFLISHFFLLVRSSDFFLRLPSALFGIGSLPLLFILTKKVISKQAAIFATLFMAVSPFHVWYSQDGRMYAQLIFLSLLTTLLLLKAVEQKRVYGWALYALVMAAGIGTQVFMAFAVFSHLLWLLLCHRRRLLPFSASIAGAVLPFLPWASLFIHSFSVSTGKSGRAGLFLGDLPYTLFTYVAGFSLGPSVAEFNEDRSLEFILESLPIILTVVVPAGVLLIIGMVALRNCPGRNSLILCLVGLFVPLLSTLVYSLALRFNVRYTVVAFPYFCMIIGAGLPYVFHRNKIVGFVFSLAIVAISAWSLFNYFENPRYAKEDVRSAVGFWKRVPDPLPLFSNITHTVNRYLDEEEEARHVSIQNAPHAAFVIHDFFDNSGVTSGYVLLARDWQQKTEKAIREAFTVMEEKKFAGATLFKITHLTPN